LKKTDDDDDEEVDEEEVERSSPECPAECRDDPGCCREPVGSVAREGDSQ
jgi:hypothetical protein